MAIPKILVFAGSLRAGSHNARLAALAAKELTIGGAEVTRISLSDFPMPLYDGDAETETGAPENAVKLKHMMLLHHGVFIAAPEYNASVAPVLKNTLDWISRAREPGEGAVTAFKNRVFALGAASNGVYGGMRGLMALRQVLELGCGALVIPEQIVVMKASEAFDDMDRLTDERAAGFLKNVAQRLTETARQFL